MWVPTIAGNALAKAQIGSPMARRKARALLDGAVGRASQVNENGDWLHYVTEIVLYGSLARSDDAPAGDVDLAVRLEPRYPHEACLRR